MIIRTHRIIAFANSSTVTLNYTKIFALTMRAFYMIEDLFRVSKDISVFDIKLLVLPTIYG